MDWQGDLPRCSPLGRRQPELRQPIRLPQQQGAESTEMAMHGKANRVGLTQRIEAATYKAQNVRQIIRHLIRPAR